MARIYVAAKFEEAKRAREVMDLLEARGHVVSHDWTSESVQGLAGQDLEDYLSKCARQDFFGVTSADAVLVLNHDKLFGGMVEFGVALSLGKKIVVVEPGVRDCIFWHMKEVQLVANVHLALEFIDKEFPVAGQVWWLRLQFPVWVGGRFTESIDSAWKRLYGETLCVDNSVKSHEFGDSTAYLMSGNKVAFLNYIGFDSIYELK
jgi:hypothetical protein